MKEKEICTKCKQLRYMTRHHVKNEKGQKTGEIKKMCRDCHDEWEEYYRLHGITDNLVERKKEKEKNQTKGWKKIKPKLEPILPYYTLKKSA